MQKNIKIKFWIRVAKLRKQNWRSQEKFAQKCKFHRTYISLLETGKRNISLENILTIANTFWLTLAELMKEVE